MKKAFLLLLFTALLASCRKDDQNVSESDLTVRASSEEYISIKSGETERSDPFQINDLYVSGDSAYFEVSYSGGCKEHTFEVIWSEIFSDTKPASTGFIVIHDAHNDACEALITETLSFNLEDIGEVSFDTICINVINGWAPSDSLTAGGWTSDYDVVFPQGDECTVEVTATGVICGVGLYGNLWLALNDSVSSGNEEYYFRKYLQPVALSPDVSGFKPVPGKKYIIGARIQKDNPYAHAMVCLAYSGPSVPVRITCVSEAE